MRLTGFGMMLEPLGKLAHRAAAAASLRRRKRPRISRSASGCSFERYLSAAAAHWRVWSSGVAPMPPKLNTDIAGGEGCGQRRSQPRGLVAEVLRPGEAKPALREGSDQEGEMLVLALADQELVADDEGAEHGHSGGFLRPSARSSSRPPMCWPLTKTCGTVPRPVIAPTTRERSLWLSVTPLYCVAEAPSAASSPWRRTRSPRA